MRRVDDWDGIDLDAPRGGDEDDLLTLLAGRVEGVYLDARSVLDALRPPSGGPSPWVNLRYSDGVSYVDAGELGALACGSGWIPGIVALAAEVWGEPTVVAMAARLVIVHGVQLLPSLPTALHRE